MATAGATETKGRHVDSNMFDTLVRQAVSGRSRRGLVRGGMAALAASILGKPEQSSANGRQEKPIGRKRRLICFRGETLVVRRRARFFRQGATKGPCPDAPAETCPANLPITCGDGCCPNEFPKCCAARLGQNPGSVGRATVPSTCNPQDFNCCPVEQGGGSCGGSSPQCCPPSKSQPFGVCVPTDFTCCPVALGGGACFPEAPVCCPGDSLQGGTLKFCCRPGETCCDATGACPEGFFCSGGPGGCCQPPVEALAASARQSSSPRFHMPAQ